MTVDEIVCEVEKFPSRHCVLTGGEPMIARGIHELAERLRAAGKHITIETAGTVGPGAIACDLASLSPKLSHSQPADPVWRERHNRLRGNPAVLAEWANAYQCQWKFVVSGRSDLAEIDDLLAAVGRQVVPGDIQLMPEGIGGDGAGISHAEVVALCLEAGYRYCDRLHIRLFGNTKGT